MKILTYEDLKRDVNITELCFESTKDLKYEEELIGQSRGANAINFGLNVRSQGYNIYVAGDSGTGKTTYATNFAIAQAKLEPIPKDLCYVYNFENPKEPILLRLDAGKGKELQEDLEELICLLQDELPRGYNDKKLDEKKNQLIKDFQDDREKIIKNLSEEVKDDNFGIKSSTSGIYLMPIKNGAIISEEEFEKLPEIEKDEITRNSEIVNLKASGIIQEIKNKEKYISKKLDEIDFTVALLIVGKHFGRLIEKYNKLSYAKLDKYILEMKEDILNNIEDFMMIEEESEEPLQGLLPFIGKNLKEDFLFKYTINLFVDNSSLKHAPVIVEYNTNYTNLIGEIEYESEGNSLSTSFLKIKSGAIHKALGGYLILQAYDLLNNAVSYESLRRCLKSKKIVIEASKEYLSGATIASLKPEECFLDVKIILVGLKNYYDLINYYDDDFRKYFKILSIFDYEMDYNKKNAIAIGNFVKGFVLKENSLDFHIDAIKEIIKYSSRLAESRNKLSTNFNMISELLAESNAWAKIEKKDIITKEYIVKAINERNFRLNGYEEKLNEMIEENVILIDTKERVVGQINGLAVLDTGDYEFAKPSRITVTTYMGKAGIVNIEKESDLSGSFHDKGIQVVTGYLGETFAQKFPLCLCARICFEQNYSGIDGDSASSTELYALLSSLSEVPIKQNIAVTGSVNQKGIIQPIGGVTCKVEGFFDLCKKRGLTGEEGVIIPIQNVKDLVLNEEVLDAIKNNTFSIYAIENIGEGIELLTDVRKEKINELVYNKLEKYYEQSQKEIG